MGIFALQGGGQNTHELRGYDSVKLLREAVSSVLLQDPEVVCIRLNGWVQVALL